MCRGGGADKTRDDAREDARVRSVRGQGGCVRSEEEGQETERVMVLATCGAFGYVVREGRASRIECRGL